MVLRRAGAGPIGRSSLLGPGRGRITDDREYIGPLGGASNGIRLSASTFTAGSAEGTAIGDLSVVGGTGTYTFTLTDSASNKVKVAGTNGVNLQAGSASSSAGSFSITVHADNGAGSTFDKVFLITAVASAGDFAGSFYQIIFQ